MYYLYEGPLGLSLFRQGGDKLELVSHHAYKTIEEAFEQQRAIPSGDITKVTQEFLEANFPASLRSEKLGVLDPRLAQTLKSQLNLLAVCTDEVTKMHRQVLQAAQKLIPQLNIDKQRQFEAALSHDVSRLQIRFNVEAVDTMIVQAVKLLDEAEKESNIYAMRVAEWAVWSFPEAQRIVQDNGRFCRLMSILGADRSCLLAQESRNDVVPQLQEFLSEEVIDSLVSAAQVSVGVQITEEDRQKVQKLSKLVISLQKQREELEQYIEARMSKVAPNFTAIVGASVGARLLARAGSLMKLAKAPASTIQILGAEATLFKALKAGSKTPKYGFLYGCQLVQQASQGLKGRVARKVAQSAALCVRYDTLHECGAGEKEDENTQPALAQRLLPRCDVTTKSVQKADKVAKLQQYRLRTDALTESEAAKQIHTKRVEYKGAEGEQKQSIQSENGQEARHRKHKSKSYAEGDNQAGNDGNSGVQIQENQKPENNGDDGDEQKRRHKHKHRHRKVDQ